ncbi:MAG: LptF/LptG family permease [Gemmatimonadota bacterium]|nr:LptF/LptG family permease [Gemmatimonadota bacterium]MDH5758536.1 LptF/LptG family permease [Gemmatimonadota bacterium]
MIRILDRFVAGTFLRLFLLFMAGSPPLFILADFTERRDVYIDQGLTTTEIALSFLYQMPQYFQWSFPVAALVAAVFTVHGMTTHREIVAAKAGGISFHRLVAPVLVLGLVLTGAALSLEDLVPRGNRLSAKVLRQEPMGRSWRSEFVYESEGGMTWQVKRLTSQDGRMTSVILESADDPEEGGFHLTADAAMWDSIDGWTFQRGWIRFLRPDGGERAMEFEEVWIPGLEERPRDLMESTPEPKEMTYAEVDRLARMVERSGGDAKRLLVQKEQKRSIPVATLVIILFGVPLATSSKRGGAAYGIGLSLATTILYLLLLKVSGALGTAGALSPVWAAWSPNLLFASTAAVLLARVRT